MTRKFFVAVVLFSVLFPACDNDPSGNNNNACDSLECGEHATCVENGDDATCLCDSGYHQENGVCVVDSTDVNNNPNPCESMECGEHGSCIVRDGDAECVCETGYTGKSCEDCVDGYIALSDGRCVADSCVDATCNHGTCVVDPDDGSASCRCDSGYTGANCDQCDTGYIQLNDGSCVVDPCANQTCSGHGTCVVDTSNGSASCQCDSGFEANGLSCVDIDECANGTASCDTNATCTNTQGSYTCTCNNGYTGDGFTCTNVNECTAGTYSCPAHSVCVDTEGSYNCQCETGYTGANCTECETGYVQLTGGSCVVDTCDPNPCQNGGVCSVNQSGVAECQCATGYTGQYCDACDAGYVRLDNGSCVADPCAGVDCSGHGTCVVDTSNGSASCQCDSGFEVNGLSCVDIDECAIGTASCDTNATCTNLEGSYTCTCNAGYTGDGFTCSDVDECVTGTASCDANATCTNTEGGYTCICNAGYTGDGFTCSDVDECATGTDSCDANATCTNLEGSYTCTCNAGYTGDGFTCTDVDECATGQYNCPANAHCVNTVGSYDCRCASGYTGANCDQCDTGYIQLNDGSCVADPCASDPCGVGGECSVDLDSGSASCQCYTGYTGTNCDQCTPRYREVVADSGISYCTPKFGRISGGAIQEFVVVNGELYAFGMNEIAMIYDATDDSWWPILRRDLDETSYGSANSVRNDFLSASVAEGSSKVFLLNRFWDKGDFLNIYPQRRNAAWIYDVNNEEWLALPDIPTDEACWDMRVSPQGGHLWAVCDDGKVYAYDFANANWLSEQVTDSTDLALNRLWWLDEDHVFVVGDQGLIKEYDFVNDQWLDWSNSSILDTDLYGIWGYSVDNFYLGGTGKLWHWDGSQWTEEWNTGRTGHYVRKISGNAEKLVVLEIGDRWEHAELSTWTHIYDIASGTWSYLSEPYPQYWWAISCFADDCLLGGMDGATDRPTRLRWLSEPEDDLKFMFDNPAIAGKNANDVVQVSRASQFVWFNGHRWYRYDVPASVTEAGNDDFHAVATDGTGYWLAGPGADAGATGYFVYWNGQDPADSANWQKFSSDATAQVWSIHACSATDVWAGADYRQVLHWDGNAWQRIEPIPGPGCADENCAYIYTVRNIYCKNSNEIYATVGIRGAFTRSYIWRWDGVSWVQVYDSVDFVAFSNFFLDKQSGRLYLGAGGTSDAPRVLYLADDGTWQELFRGIYPIKWFWKVGDVFYALDNLYARIRAYNISTGDVWTVLRETSNTDDQQSAYSLQSVYYDQDNDFTVIVGNYSKVIINTY